MDYNTSRNIAFQEFLTQPRAHRPWLSSTETELALANQQFYFVDNTLASHGTIRLKYEKVFHQTKAFVDIIRDLASTLSKLGDGSQSWARISTLIVEYSIYLLQVEGLHFERFLSSQRISIYALLDDLLLRICVGEWESESNTAPWNIGVQPITAAMDSGFAKIDAWNPVDRSSGYKHTIGSGWEESKKALIVNYFKRTRAFLEESLRVYYVRKTVNQCERGRLPTELVDIIAQDVLIFEGLPPGRLRARHLPSGKAKA